MVYQAKLAEQAERYDGKAGRRRLLRGGRLDPRALLALEVATC